MKTTLVDIASAWGEAMLFHPETPRPPIANAGCEVLLESMLLARDGRGDGARERLQGWLDTLDANPADAGNDPVPPAPPPSSSSTSDGIALLTVGRLSARPTAAERTRWDQIVVRVRNAQRIVVDLRQGNAGAERFRGWPDASISFLEWKPNERNRVHCGWRSEGRADTGRYESQWRITGTTPQPDLPRVCFVTDGATVLPAVAAALRTWGSAFFVAVGNAPLRFAGESHATVAGFRIRVGEFPTFDGPDRRCGVSDNPIEIALELLRRAPRTADSGVFPNRPAGVPAAALTDVRIGALRALSLLPRLVPYAPRPSIAQWETALRNACDIDPDRRIAALRVFLGAFRDGHARVRTGSPDDPVSGTPPPVRLRMVGGKPVVAAIQHPVASELGARLGDIVLAVDGEPVAKRQGRLAALLPAGNDTARGLYVANRLLSGRPLQDVRVRAVGMDGRRREWVLPRNAVLFPDGRPRERSSAPVRRVGNRVVFDVDRLAPDTARAGAFSNRDAACWVIDLRGEANQTAWTLVPLCLKTTVDAARFLCPMAISTAFAPEQGTREIPLRIEPGAWRFRGDLVCLVDERTQSQSEIAAMMFRAAGAVLVGSPTAGAVGDVTEMALGGDVWLSFTGQRVTLPGGGAVHGAGLRPDVLVQVSRADLAAGRDPVLDAALKLDPRRPRR